MASNEVTLSYLDKLRLINRDARLTIFSNIFWAFAWGIDGVIFNLYLIESGFDETFLGFYLSISMFVMAFLSIPAGMLTDRRSKKKIILIGQVAIFLVVIMQYNSLLPFTLILGQAIIGFASSFTNVAWGPYTLNVTTDEERVHLFSVRTSFFLIANLCGSLVGGFLPGFWMQLGLSTTHFWAYRYTLWFALIPMSIGAIALIPLSHDKPEPTMIPIGLDCVKSHGFIAKNAIPMASIGLGAGMFVMFMNVYFNRLFQADAATIGVLFAMNTVTLAIANAISPMLVDRLGKIRTVIITQALSLPFLVLLSVQTDFYIAAIAFITRAMLMNMGIPVWNVFFLENLEKEERATAMGIRTSADQLVRGIAANIGGWLLATGLYRMPFTLAITLYILGIAQTYWFFGRPKSETYELELESDLIILPQEEKAPIEVT
jgi:MFS family permease